MNKKLLFSFILTIIFLSYIFNIDRLILNKLSVLNTDIQNSYISKIISTESFISTYFNQAQQIEKLKVEVKENEQYKILYNKIKKSSLIEQNSSLESIKVISYINFTDFSKVNLSKIKNSNNIFALITKDGNSAGIVKHENNATVGYLNHNTKCSYAVFMGDEKIPGITHGNLHKDIITVKFIPLWQKLNIGDEVITSGMDNIFYEGVPVGKVISIKKLSNSQEATVKPYAEVYNENYFYVYKNQDSLGISK